MMRDMTTQIGNLHVRLVGLEPKQALRNSKAAANDSTPINEADLAAQPSQLHCTGKRRRSNHDMLLTYEYSRYVEVIPQGEDFNKVYVMPEDYSVNESEKTNRLGTTHLIRLKKTS